MQPIHSNSVFLFCFLLFVNQLNADTILQSDNFDDSSLDATKWTTDTSPAFSWGGRSVSEIGGAIELRNKGYLITSEEYDPAAVGGLKITGVWEAKSHADVLNVVTRANAVPTINFLNVDKGITFRMFVFGGSGFIQIERLEGGSSNAPGKLIAFQELKIDAGDRFEFEVTDDGTNVSFSVQEIGGDNVSATIGGECTNDNATDLIVFHNRENGYMACLDDVVISSISSSPEDIVLDLLVAVEALGLPRGLENSLVRKLESALDHLENGRPYLAVFRLASFARQVRFLPDWMVAEEDADYLIDGAIDAILLILDS